MNEFGLGLRRGTVRVVPWDRRWAKAFEAARAEIEGSLGDAILGVEHVGSTSVPGLSAKPILDVLVLVPDFEAARMHIEVIEGLDYLFRPQEDIPDRHYFRRPRLGDVRTHHLSLATPRSHHARVTLAFRDALRADAELAGRYGELKRELEARFPRDRMAYIDGKTDFVLGVVGPT